MSYSEYLFVDRENVPCWWEISWQAKPQPAIIVKVHEDFVNDFPSLNDAPIVVMLAKDFNLLRFDGGIKGESFGFEGVFKRTGQENGFVVFTVDVPAVFRKTKRACPECKGKKKDEFGKCLYCSGSGVEIEIDWHQAFAVSATFSVFFAVASLRERKDKMTSCSFPQLITIETITSSGPHGGSLSGKYSVPLVRLLSSFVPGTPIIEMTEAMKVAYAKMHGRIDSYTGYSFRTDVAYENGWLNVSCPGDACGLHPSSGRGPEEGVGYEFSCHNVDSPMQQITLLAGLAALCDKARKEITSY